MSADFSLPDQEAKDNLKKIWKDAISTFEESANTNLKDTKLAETLADGTSIDRIEAALEAHGTDLKTFRKKGQSIRSAFKPLLRGLNAIVEPLGEFVSFAGVPGGKAIFVAVATLLKAIDGVSQVYDHLTGVLEQIQDVFSRLQILSDADAITPALRKLYIQALSQVLIILGFYIRYSNSVHRESKWMTKMKVWIVRSYDLISSATGNTEIQDALSKFGELGRRIQQTVATEIMASSTKTKQQDSAWLAAPDPDENQEERRKQGSTVPEHGQWLLNLPEFRKWVVDPSGFFWLSASAGVGKSVLFSRVVDYLKQDPSTSLAAFAFFYFDYRDEAKQNYRNFLASIVQSFGESSASCKELLRSLEKRKRNASESELETLLWSMIDTPGAKFLAIDAIDECWESERAKSLLPLLQRLSRNWSSGSGNLQIFVTSRPEPDIEEALWTLDNHVNRAVIERLQLGEREEHLNTLRNFIRAELASKKFKGLGWSSNFTREVENELLARSDSMFLWVQLQLEQLMRCSEHDARRNLPKLPRTLKGTYARVLKSIDDSRQRTVRTILECIISAARPLSEKEIGDIFLFDLDFIDERPSCLSLESITADNLEETRYIHNSVDIFKLLPSSLLRRGPHGEVSFIHFTVQEYLLSEPMSLRGQTSQARDDVLAAFSTSREKAHSTALIISLSALDDKNRKKLPNIGKYCDESWFIHAKSAMSHYSLISPALAHFLSPESTSFDSWAVRRGVDTLSPYDPRKSAAQEVIEIKPVGQDLPIHWAVRIGSLNDVRRLIELDNLDKHGSSGTDIRNAQDMMGWTPLCHAACIGDMSMMDVLLEGNTSWALQNVGSESESCTILHLLIPGGRLPDVVTESRGFAQECNVSLFWPASSAWWFAAECRTATKKLLATAPSLPDFLSAGDSTGESPLGQFLCHSSFISNLPVESFEMLLDYGADPETQSKEGRTTADYIVEYACATSDASFISTCAKRYGVNMNTGRPLFWAVEKEAVQCVQALLELHVDPNMCNEDGKGPLDCALEFHPQSHPNATVLYTKKSFKQAARRHHPSQEQQRIYELLEQYGGELHHVIPRSIPLSRSSSHGSFSDESDNEYGAWW
ncbi:hypothetical protein DL93DRAFT_2234373 [Clavulina sp. PMI_390]|nr:hypothetical protein DL93DRAFT_2234373 [Clavulina sp. PMI_390]